MDAMLDFLLQVFGIIPAQMWIPIGIFAAVAIFAQYLLYEKAGCKGIACIVPIWNVYEFMKIMGRPGWHSLFIIVPPPIIAIIALADPTAIVNLSVAGALLLALIVFVIKVYIELCQSFGRTRFLDYFLVIIFNGAYVLYLGMSNINYKGPVYNKQAVAKKTNTSTATA